MNVFPDYTGNAMLNNALQTIEAMAKLEHVSQITPELLLAQFRERNLPKLYARMKNYTIIFTRNGPLLNDQKFGEQIYRRLFEAILRRFENEGENQCEISGLRFKTTFPEIYTEILQELNIDPKSRDTSINRAWWPLVGALGSDAQALPRAKFSVQIHPICLAAIQFLPLSAVLYHGKVLLVESVNFKFARMLVDENFRRVSEQIAYQSLQKSIDNVKFSKPEYLTLAIENFDNLSRHQHEDDNTDLNFWMFSNSGAGAACEIDRIPNSLFQKLCSLYGRHHQELREILKGKGGFAFLNCLDANTDFWGLYPAKKWSGVTVGFFEDYYNLIDNDARLHLAGYIAGLIKKYKSDKDEKLLKKTDAHTQKDYNDFLFPILIKAAQVNEWDLLLHAKILDDPEAIPIKSSIFKIFKMIHFYYQKGKFKAQPSNIDSQRSEALQICRFFADMIQNDDLAHSITKTLTDPQNFRKAHLNGAIARAAAKVTFEEIYAMLYEEGARKHFGLLTLLRLHFSSQKLPDLPEYNLAEQLTGSLTKSQKALLHKYRHFVQQYTAYYTTRYGKDGIEFPHRHFRKNALDRFPKTNTRFFFWLSDVVQQMNEFPEKTWETVDGDALCYDENGVDNLTFTRFAIEFFLHKITDEQQKAKSERDQ